MYHGGCVASETDPRATPACVSPERGTPDANTVRFIGVITAVLGNITDDSVDDGSGKHVDIYNKCDKTDKVKGDVGGR